MSLPSSSQPLQSNKIANRLAAIRSELANANLDAFIIPRADEYLGEYVPEHNERLYWATDFTGSAGMAIVLKDKAAIFTDGRYTVQVRLQVDANLFSYESLTDTPQIEWLCDTLPAGARVGFDARLHTLAWFENAKATLAKAQIELVAVEQNPIDKHWQNRPAPSSAPITLFSNDSAGKTSLQKRTEIGALVKKAGADVALIAALDSFCWLLNIRGNDVPRLPVVLGCALLHANGDMQLFTDLSKLPEGIEEHVGAGVSFNSEAALADTLASLQGVKLLADPNSANAWAQNLARDAGAKLIAGIDPVSLPKAQKNAAELAGMRASHIRDGVAVSRFLAWLDAEVAANRLHDEATLADKLESFRLEDPQYREPSFDTISAAGANAAMCHYNHNNGTPAMMTMDSIYLVDSGAQYLDGTTDVTRTIAIGKVTDEQKKMVTLVLKGHIALDQARYPKGTTGQQLDAFARQYLWQHGFDYDHGTGHGVGHFLSVHEGPQRIGKNLNAIALMPGMVLSNEPGYYRTDSFGIRLENLVVVQHCEALKGAEREMYEFDALTLIPMDARLIDKSLLTQGEIDWFNAYHQKVFNTLSPLMSGTELEWLKQATQAI
ncbi:aminopeptidase P family protein [Shewanella xiamenensis]|uniref:aminopeptidase P family protein n=1 Tax=Shewanella xiamenensis TaxID=332186 RepID=UPI0024A637E8|nr:aminopeptidase P family protein [Shewanella xiamenensis]MDI5836640.1 aminopeptidase P family protein [Shewanella xiamenensis]MDI5840097.1 aminopeptidase P family protein [Shewanella xiamenensis]MDI5844100.1 aminopeptidase P family protein [Shewanella xiamenensis]MDI5847541.1 aminopeptidase P family protein [Shewanella xiamenensis]MDI5852057.1 aminopeptidase P family protein [Shewanella xiamenensis]